MYSENNIKLFILGLLLVILVHSICFGSTNDVYSQREINLFKEIRCQICQGENIYESQVNLAKDIRALIKDKIAHGKTDVEVKEFLKSRYGNDILLATEFNIYTIFIWIFPFILLSLGIYRLFKV